MWDGQIAYDHREPCIYYILTQHTYQVTLQEEHVKIPLCHRPHDQYSGIRTSLYHMDLVLLANY